MTTTGEALAASQEATLVIELFLNENYRFRRNVLNGKVEFAILPKETGATLSGASKEAELIYRPLTQAALNSIVIRAKREQVLEKGNPKTEITEYVQSEEVPEHNPVQDFLNSLPQWDEPHCPHLRTHSRHHVRAAELPDHLAALGCSPLDAAGHAAWQRVCANADWCSGLW